jgi:cell division initiation protein
MEISGQTLREVEFRDRLRGYDTDEVDEFLERVAVAVDELHAQIEVLSERAARPERKVEEPVLEDDSIRRTLILAQRTADLAIKEAQEEAAGLIEEAQRQCDELIAQAQESARRMRAEAEADFEERVGRLTAQREKLEIEVRTLSSLVDGERERITESLRSVLQFVGETMVVAAGAELVSVVDDADDEEEIDLGILPDEEPATPSAPPATAPVAGTTTRERLFDDDDEDLGLPDLEAEIAEDAELAFGGREPRPAPEPDSALDPDEELWARWAQSNELNDPEMVDPADPFRFGKKPGPGEVF